MREKLDKFLFLLAEKSLNYKLNFREFIFESIFRYEVVLFFVLLKRLKVLLLCFYMLQPSISN